MATPSLVTSIAVAGANTPLTVTPSSGTGAVTITSNIPTYTSSQGITRFTEATSPVNYDFRGTYENISGGAGISFAESGGLYVIDAAVASVNPVGRGITTTTDSETGQVTINAAVASFSGPNPGIIFSGPDSEGVVYAQPNICDLTPGNGISISRPDPHAPTISALVADIQPGAGVGVSKNITTGVFTVSADVVDVTSTLASGIQITTSGQNVKSAALNIALPTNTGLQQGVNPGGQYTLFTNYNNLIQGIGTTVARTSGITPTASITANVASLNPTSKGITTLKSSDGENEWTITNTGVISVDSASPAIGVSTDPSSGVVTLTYNPSETFADEQVLEGSLQVPILIGGRIQGSHFNGYSTIPGQTITCIQPLSTSVHPGDCMISVGSGILSVSNGVPTATVLQNAPQISSFVYVSLNQQAPGVPTSPGSPFNADTCFFSYYNQNAQNNNGATTGYQVAAYRINGQSTTFSYYSSYPGEYIWTMVPALGVAVNPANMYSLIAGSAGLWIGQPYLSGTAGVNFATLLTGGGTYSNPVVTRMYNRANASDAANMLRARCFCTKENGGLYEIQMTTASPYFSSPALVPGSPSGSGWLPLKVVPLQDQWVNSSSTAKFDYLIYMSNSIITSVYNTSTLTWSNITQPGYTGALSNQLVASFANPGDTLYSQFIGGGLITSDLPLLSTGSYPTWSSSAQTASLFFPPPLDYDDVITFGCAEGFLFQSTFTPDITEILANQLQVKAIDSIILLTDGDCAISSSSLEIQNAGMTLSSGVVDIYTDSLAVHSGSIDMDQGTALNADTVTAGSLSATGVVDFGSAVSVNLPFAYGTNLTRGSLLIPITQAFVTSTLATLGVQSGVWKNVTITFPTAFPTDNVGNVVLPVTMVSIYHNISGVLATCSLEYSVQTVTPTSITISCLYTANNVPTLNASFQVLCIQQTYVPS